MVGCENGCVLKCSVHTDTDAGMESGLGGEEERECEGGNVRVRRWESVRVGEGGEGV